MELTGLEICKRIAQIEDKYKELLGKQASYNSRLVHVQEKVNITRWFNPLIDDALCFQLMVKHGIRSGFSICPAGSGEAYYADFNQGTEVTDYYHSMNKAICMAIIEANKPG